MATLFSEAYEDVVEGLASRAFSADSDWQKLLVRARKMAGAQGFEANEASLAEDLRKKLRKACASGVSEAASLFAGAGENLSGKGANPLVDGELAKRLGALKTLRHTYFLKRFGGHKVWCVDIPPAFADWPCLALRGELGATTTCLNARDERFADERRKHLANASQEALKWVHKAMLVTSGTGKSGNFELVARWFADGASKDKDVLDAAATLAKGLKKIATTLKSGRLIYCDSVSERGSPELDGVEAFVWGDPLDVVYIEEEFFGNRNTLQGLTNWARIVVHELTHRDIKTKDHAYEHQGINPIKLTAAKAIENADSWAWFCADCAGALTSGQVRNALDR
ncbi:M35 family metallo-endopeptidase [Frateuria soli]|uniref:M35 family metallo-endopeptidase n=1 Tax=Frateuria soli TaxID=1542730 RepID=UPI001E48F68B|nr:M35 family metallo-endopeptidase [Frateuria soli]UGB39147.1 M35 family metallo-endopeptidase [Frateuria soli]